MVSKGLFDSIQVSVEPLAKGKPIECDWRELESRASGSVFLSWPWVSTWLKNAQANLTVIRMSLHGKLIALGVFADSQASRPLGSSMPVMGLHEVPEAPLSKIATEYNGLICDVSYEDIAHERLAVFLAHEWHAAPSSLRWRECRLPGLSAASTAAVQKSSVQYRLYRKSVAPYVGLTESFSDSDSYLKILSKNTRHQIRRSLKIYEDRGALTLMRPNTLDDANKCLERMIQLHQTQWRARGKCGAFSTTAFLQFHTDLLHDAFANGMVDLVEVRAAGEMIGILYNLVYEGIVSSYQSGFAFEQDNRLKPGLVCHALAISDYASSGVETYRFLAGDQRYKKSLATGTDTLYWLAIQRPDMRMRVENTLRKIKSRLRVSGDK